MLKVGVQVQQAVEGRVKVNEWKTVIEPVAVDEFKAKKLKGLADVMNARLTFEITHPNDFKELHDMFVDFHPKSASTHPDRILEPLEDLFANHPLK